MEFRRSWERILLRELFDEFDMVLEKIMEMNPEWIHIMAPFLPVKPKTLRSGTTASLTLMDVPQE